MKNINILIVLLLTFMPCWLQAQQLLDVELGLSSYVGGYYYQDNDKKDFEYKSNHNWYLNLAKQINDNIYTSAEIRYFPELFDKQLYLYSARVNYISQATFDIAWEFDRIGLGRRNLIFNNSLNDIRSDQNFITDYRFNGAVVNQKVLDNLFIQYRAGGNDFNTGIGEIKVSLNQNTFNLQQSFLMVSRDNRFNAKAINLNNFTRWVGDTFLIQNMFHSSFIDYYRKGAKEKSSVVKDMIETRFSFTPILQPQLSFYYEAENWNKYKIYEVNGILNIIANNYEISPAFKIVNYLENIHREYSLLVNYHLHPKWEIGLLTKYIDTKTNQDIISYGLQTKFNLPGTSFNLKSLYN